MEKRINCTALMRALLGDMLINEAKYPGLWLEIRGWDSAEARASDQLVKKGYIERRVVGSFMEGRLTVEGRRYIASR